MTRPRTSLGRLGRVALVPAVAVLGLLASCTPSTPGEPSEPAADTERRGPAESVDTDQPMYFVEEGEPVRVGLQLTTRAGLSLEDTVTVDFDVAPGSAAADDFSAPSGSVVFEPGTPSGAVEHVTITVYADDEPEFAETIVLSFASDDVALAPAMATTVVVNANGFPYLDPERPIGDRVNDLLDRMTIEEMVGQMALAEREAFADGAGEIRTLSLGAVLSGGGSAPTPNTPEAWADMIDGFQREALQTRLQIPIIYGTDAVHGHNNLDGATIFPHNIGLGAAGDPDLARRVGEVTAAETRATGAHWTFGPCVCVARDERWGRTYESFGEDPAGATAMTTIIDGLQGDDVSDPDRVLATAKHFVGDGGTTFGTSSTETYTIDQGITQVTLEQLRSLHLEPYEEAIARRVGSVMVSFSSVDLIDDPDGPIKMHADGRLVTGVLKDDLGFEGFVVSDWLGIDQIPGDPPSDVRTAVNAGVDMIMAPGDYGRVIADLLGEIAAGRVSRERIQDAVRRILVPKFELGLFEQPFTDRSHLGDIGSADHRAVAREAAADSQVLLKNDGDVLPLAPDARIYVAGSNADDLGHQMGGWTMTWQGASGPITEGTTILAGMAEVAPGADLTYSRDATASMDGFDAGVVVVGEAPYAEGHGDVGNGHDLDLTPEDRAAVDRVCAALPCVVIVVAGRPQIVTDQLDAIDALVAAWLPGSEGAGVADTLFGEVAYTGTLPMSWPRSIEQLPINVGDPDYDPLFPFGFGLVTEAR
jgi:beta-glucosidase